MITLSFQMEKLTNPHNKNDLLAVLEDKMRRDFHDKQSLRVPLEVFLVKNFVPSTKVERTTTPLDKPTHAHMWQLRSK